MTSVATTLIVLCVAMWKYGIKTNNFVGTDCLSTVFAYGLITKKYAIITEHSGKLRF